MTYNDVLAQLDSLRQTVLSMKNKEEKQSVKVTNVTYNDSGDFSFKFQSMSGNKCTVSMTNNSIKVSSDTGFVIYRNVFKDNKSYCFMLSQYTKGVLPSFKAIVWTAFQNALDFKNKSNLAAPKKTKTKELTQWIVDFSSERRAVFSKYVTGSGKKLREHIIFSCRFGSLICYGESTCNPVDKFSFIDGCLQAINNSFYKFGSNGLWFPIGNMSESAENEVKQVFEAKKGVFRHIYV